MAKGVVVSLFAVLWLACASAQADAVAEQAQRHFDRGMAAVEMAAALGGYESAIDEFRQARELAPDWPDVHYQLGLAAEKAGRYGDAARSLGRYLELAPDAADAADIQARIDADEAKAAPVVPPSATERARQRIRQLPGSGADAPARPRPGVH